MQCSHIDKSFFERDTRLVAKELLSKVLVWENHFFKIVETEAYLGPNDLASYARFKSRKRNHLMFKESGHLYVYMTYGMYYMLNIIAKPPDSAGGVLIRGLQSMDNDLLLNGPGKITRHLKITKEHNGLSVFSETIHIEDRGFISKEIISTPRIGIDYAGEYKDKLWRFYIK